jgi:hypothetical protein
MRFACITESSLKRNHRCFGGRRTGTTKCDAACALLFDLQSCFPGQFKYLWNAVLQFHREMKRAKDSEPGEEEGTEDMEEDMTMDKLMNRPVLTRWWEELMRHQSPTTSSSSRPSGRTRGMKTTSDWSALSGGLRPKVSDSKTSKAS